MSHEPVWLEDWYCCSNETAANLKQLIRQQLRGRARVHLAGDIHFFMRHSLVILGDGQQHDHYLEQPSSHSLRNEENGLGVGAGTAESAQSKRMPATKVLDDMAPNEHTVHSFVKEQVGKEECNIQQDSKENFGTEKPSRCLDSYVNQEKDDDTDGRVVSMLDDKEPSPSQSTVTSSSSEELQDLLWKQHALDPQHLIVNGLGGAFLHPTHVFSGSHFCGKMRNLGHTNNKCFHRNNDLNDGTNQWANLCATGEYRCQAVYPPPSQSVKLGQENLFRFRWKVFTSID